MSAANSKQLHEDNRIDNWSYLWIAMFTAGGYVLFSIVHYLFGELVLKGFCAAVIVGLASAMVYAVWKKTNSEKRSLLLSLLMTKHRHATVNTWQTEAMISMIGVADSDLNTSLGAGTANQLKLGNITNRKRIKPQTSNPNRYLLNNFIVILRILIVPAGGVFPFSGKWIRMPQTLLGSHPRQNSPLAGSRWPR